MHPVIIISLILTIGIQGFTNLLINDEISSNFLIYEIISLVFVFISLILPYISLPFKDGEIRNKFLSINIIMSLFLIIVSFIYIFIEPIVIIFSFLIFISEICNIVLHLICLSINVRTLSNEKVASVEEVAIKEEIEKLRAKVRIKNLEKEYLELKSKLDE